MVPIILHAFWFVLRKNYMDINCIGNNIRCIKYFAICFRTYYPSDDRFESNSILCKLFKTPAIYAPVFLTKSPKVSLREINLLWVAAIIGEKDLYIGLYVFTDHVFKIVFFKALYGSTNFKKIFLDNFPE